LRFFQLLEFFHLIQIAIKSYSSILLTQKSRKYGLFKDPGFNQSYLVNLVFFPFVSLIPLFIQFGLSLNTSIHLNSRFLESKQYRVHLLLYITEVSFYFLEAVLKHLFEICHLLESLDLQRLELVISHFVLYLSRHFLNT